MVGWSLSEDNTIPIGMFLQHEMSLEMQRKHTKGALLGGFVYDHIKTGSTEFCINLQLYL